MRIDYIIDTDGFEWAVVSLADGTFEHWTIGRNTRGNRAERINKMYEEIVTWY